MDNTCKRCNRPILFSEGTTQQYHLGCRQKSASDRSRERERQVRKLAKQA